MRIVKKGYSAFTQACVREADYYSLRPRNFLFFLTQRCTSRCTTCTMWQKDVKPSDELTFEDWRRFIDTIPLKYMKNVELFGGDALLRKDLVIALSTYLKAKGVASIELVTNGNLLKESVARELVSAGISRFYFSLDGIGKVHDQVRGVPGSFERIVAAVEALLGARGNSIHPEILVNCTVSSANVAAVEEIFPFAEKMGFDAVAYEYVGQFPQQSITESVFQNLTPEPYYVAQPGKPLLLDTEQGRFFKSALKRVKLAARKSRIKLITKNIDCLRISHMSSGIFPNLRCYVCRTQVSVDPYGNILPCLFFGDYSIGNVLDKEFMHIWANLRHRDFVRHRDSGKFPMCKHCIVGVERNPTFYQTLIRSYLSYTQKGYDE